MTVPVFVIGSNSYSGAAFVDHLLRLGTDVVGLSRSEEVALPFRIYAWGGKRPGRFRFERFDLNHDLDRFDELAAELRPEIVVNFSAQSMVAESWANPDHWMMTNVVSTVRLHERLRRLDHLKRYVHVTTPEVYGSMSGWVAENHNFDPSTPYAVSRAAGDMSLRSYFKAYGFPVVFTRAANVYGPGQQLYRIVPRTIFYALTGRKLQLHGGGVSQRSFIHGRDVAEATRLVAENGRNGDTYHISTNRQITIRALVEMVLQQLGLAFEDHVEVSGERLGKDQSYMLDSTKLREELGWSDGISLEAGVEETIGWVRDNLEALKKLPSDYIHKA